MRPKNSARTSPRQAKAEYTVRTKVWLYPGKGGWHFATLSPRQSAEIRQRFAAEARGWGSLPVNVRLGDTEWNTSLFPDRKSACYLFGVKASVRKLERVAAGDRITAVVRVV
jgi:hypothetical protein